VPDVLYLDRDRGLDHVLDRGLDRARWVVQHWAPVLNHWLRYMLQFSLVSIHDPLIVY
jgi:hypothetical protein